MLDTNASAARSIQAALRRKRGRRRIFKREKILIESEGDKKGGGMRKEGGRREEGKESESEDDQNPSFNSSLSFSLID